MAKQVNRVEVVEDDIFSGLAKSAVEADQKVQLLASTLEMVVGLQKEAAKNAGKAKGDIVSVDPAKVEAQKKFNDELTKANKIIAETEALNKLQLKTEQDLQKEKLKAQAINKEIKDQLKAEIALEKEQIGTLERIKVESNLLRKEREKLDLQSEKGVKRMKEINVQLDKNNDLIKESSDAHKKQILNVGNYEGALKPLKTQLREITIALQNMDEADPRFARMAAEAGQLRDKMSDTKAVIQATAGSGLENLSKGFANVGKVGIAAVQGIEGGMALFGVESEKVMETMMRLQALSALTDSIEQLGALGDTMQQIKASFAAAATQLGIFTTAKKVDTVVTEGQTVATGAANIATKALGKSMNALPVIAILTAVTALAAALYTYLNTASQVTQKQKDLNATFDSYKKGATDAVTKTNEVRVAFDLARQGTISKKEALETYNSTLGDTFGKATDLNEAERLYNEKTGAYIRATALRAQAQALLAMAAEEQVKAMTAGMEDQRSMAEESAGVISDVIAGVVDYTTAGLTDLSTEADKAQGKLYKDAQKRAEKSAKDRSDNLVKLAESLMKEAGLLEKNNGLTRESTKVNEKNTKSIKDKTSDIDEEIALQELRAEQELARKRKEKDDLDAIDLQIEEDAKKRALDAEEADEKRQERELADKRQWEDEQAKIEAKAEQKLKDQQAAAAAARFEDTKKYADLANDYLQKSLDDRIAMLDKEIEASQKQKDILAQMAANGNIEAKDSLAEQERIEQEALAKKAKLEERKRQLEIASQMIDGYLAARAEGKTVAEALAATAADRAVLESLVAALPTFLEGADRTKNVGAGVDGKGGFLSVLHPDEMVFTKDERADMGNLTRAEVIGRVHMANALSNGASIGAADWAGVEAIASLKAEITEVKKAILDKPETNIELGAITQSAMEIVHRTRAGNRTTQTSYKVKR